MSKEKDKQNPQTTVAKTESKEKPVQKPVVVGPNPTPPAFLHNHLVLVRVYTQEAPTTVKHRQETANTKNNAAKLLLYLKL